MVALARIPLAKAEGSGYGVFPISFFNCGQVRGVGHVPLRQAAAAGLLHAATHKI